MAIYMKYGNINGAVSTDKFKNWIELDSFQWGVGRGIASAARSDKSREATEPSIAEVTVTKRMDMSSPNLLLEALAGENNTKVKISFTTTTKSEVKEFLTYELTDTGISGYSLSSGGDMPSESLSLNFAQVSFKFTGTGADTGGNPETVGYNLYKMKTT